MGRGNGDHSDPCFKNVQYSTVMLWLMGQMRIRTQNAKCNYEISTVHFVLPNLYYDSSVSKGEIPLGMGLLLPFLLRSTFLAKNKTMKCTCVSIEHLFSLTMIVYEKST